MSAIELRRATPADKHVLWEWRNDAVARQMFRQSGEVSWNEHNKWYESALQNPKIVILICDRSGEPVGMVRFDLKENGVAEISINMAPSKRGQGVGGQMLTRSCRFAFDELHLKEIHAEVKMENVSSTRLFGRAGFACCETKNNLFIYRLMRNQLPKNARLASERRE